jgi:hypothetical protein
VHIDRIPPDVRLVVGMTATVEVEPATTQASNVAALAAAKK